MRTAIRLAPLAVFEEADLATFRRRILIRLCRTLLELAVEDLSISDFGLLVESPWSRFQYRRDL